MIKGDKPPGGQPVIMQFVTAMHLCKSCKGLPFRRKGCLRTKHADEESGESDGREGRDGVKSAGQQQVDESGSRPRGRSH